MRSARCLPCLLLALGAFQTAAAQDLEPHGIVSAGSTGTGTTGMLSWSMGQVCDASMSDGTNRITAGIQQPEIIWVALQMRVFLAGPYNVPTSLMGDGLRSASLIPTTEPYTALGFQHAGQGGGEQIAPAVLTTTGANAIVDWLFIELRSMSSPYVLHSTRCALLQRDGHVVDLDGVSPLRISAAPGSYQLGVRHRNHLPVMTLNAVATTISPTPVDLTNGSTATYGTNAQRLDGTVYLCWPGDVTANHQVKYNGAGNDRDPILVALGGLPNNSVSGYLPTDVTMNGLVRYTGPGNDRDPILTTIGGVVPTAVRNAQYP